MDGLYLFCGACLGYVGGGDCCCGWKNDYPEKRKHPLGDIEMDTLIAEFSARLCNYELEDFEEIIDKLRRDYVRD